MLHVAVFHPPGTAPPDKSIVEQPELARYFKAFVAQSPVEALDETHFPRACRPNKLEPHVMVVRPAVHRTTDELAAVVHGNRGTARIQRLSWFSGQFRNVHH